VLRGIVETVHLQAIALFAPGERLREAGGRDGHVVLLGDQRAAQVVDK
jgi:hypothetical protein